MSTILFLAQWALRSAILIVSGAVLLRVFRMKDPSIRLAAWTAVLAGSLMIPIMTAALPGVPLLPVTRSAAPQVSTPVATFDAAPVPAVGIQPHDFVEPKPFNWAGAALILYALIASALLLRLCAGLAISLRLLRASRTTGQTTEGVEIRESDAVAAPVTLGILRPAIVLSADWGQWNSAKLDAVLAHERSHIRRFDPAVQLISAIHRALLWFSPLSWFLHSRIVRVAEEASDDAAVAVAPDRASYAEVLLDFTRRGAALRKAAWIGVPMARYGRVGDRIHRILDATTLSRGVTRRSIVAILVLGSPLAYLVATAQPRATSVPPTSGTVNQSAPAPKAMAPAAAPAPRRPSSAPASNVLMGLGTVTASTVTVRSSVDGQLMSLNFKEGELVKAGQVVASIDPRPYEIEAGRAMAKADSDQALLARAQEKERSALGGPDAVQAAKINLQADQNKLQDAQLLVNATQIKAPITGMAGLIQVEPGNIVHPSDPVGIVTIAELQPIAVLFTLPQDCLPAVRSHMGKGSTVAVELWTRDSKTKIATGVLTAIDNQIDPETGTIKLKATFDNKDGALFPNQFVNVKVLFGPG